MSVIRSLLLEQVTYHTVGYYRTFFTCNGRFSATAQIYYTGSHELFWCLRESHTLKFNSICTGSRFKNTKIFFHELYWLYGIDILLQFIVHLSLTACNALIVCRSLSIVCNCVYITLIIYTCNYKLPTNTVYSNHSVIICTKASWEIINNNQAFLSAQKYYGYQIVWYVYKILTFSFIFFCFFL